MTDAVKKLFAQYEKAFNALDVEKQASLFAEHFISAGPQGSIALGRDEFARMASKATQFYKSMGQTSAKILLMDETAISKEYSMVKVHWGATFEKTGNMLIEFDVTS
jgi:ketosteroid isomerase-like protein